MTQTIHHLADALAALRLAANATNDGLVADRIEAAEAECYKALRQIADAQLAASDDPEEREANELLDSFGPRLDEIDRRADTV